MFRPMLATKDASRITFPVLASPKVDGIRAIVLQGTLVSRRLKPIPNRHTQALFGSRTLEGLDGELVVGSPAGNGVMQRTTSGVMTIAGEPEVSFFVFDVVRPGVPFCKRLQLAHGMVAASRSSGLVALPHTHVGSPYELEAFEAECLSAGFEGVMVRHPGGLYKYGRSTGAEGGLIKIKRFDDEEAVVVGCVEREHNENEAKEDALGHTKRSTHKAGKRGAGDLGALVCRSPKWSDVFHVGTGFTAEQRVLLWQDRLSLPGKTITFKHFAKSGCVDAPRFPVFLAFRHEDDCTEEG